MIVLRALYNLRYLIRSERSPQEIADAIMHVKSLAMSTKNIDQCLITAYRKGLLMNMWEYVESKDNRDVMITIDKTKRNIALKPMLGKVNGKYFSTPDDYAKAYTAKHFLLFIQGITLFDGDMKVGKPAYHRPTSCGPKMQMIT
jgi:hypothetical protein